MPSKPFNSQISERIRYFHGLRILVGGTKQVENEKRHQEIDTDVFRSNWNSMIWLELQAWQNGDTVSNHDQWLYETRLKKIPAVMNDINNFHFRFDEETCSFADQGGLLCVDPIDDPTKPKHLLHNSLSCLSECYFNQYFSAFNQVHQLLEDLTDIEQLFSSRKLLFIDFPYCASAEFQEKVEFLCTWYNTSFELLHNFSSIMEMLGFEEYKSLILSYISTEEDDYYSISDENSRFRSESEDGEVDDKDYNVRFAEAITKTTESYLRKHKVQNILGLLLTKHLGCLLRAHEMLSQAISNYGDHQAQDKHDEMREISSLFEVLKKSLPNFQCNVKFVQVKPYSSCFGLPDIKPLYDFIQSFIFTIMDECLTLRLDQAQQCRKQCGSTTSLLTVQQVVTECKEVIQCSLLTLRLHCALHLPDCVCVRDNHCQLKMEFKSNLMRMFHAYLDFVKLSVIALLTGLPHAPRNFIDTLHSEFEFAENTSFEVDTSSCIPCACKFINICEQMFLTTEDFLETASGAIFLSKTTKDDFEIDGLPEEAMNQKSSFFWQPAPKAETPTSPQAQAGVLWFHRQRSESPHFARHHSISYSKMSNHPILHFAQSAPALLVNSETESQRRYLFELCRALRDLFEEVRERFLHAINFAKTQRKKIESAIEFNFLTEAQIPKKLLKKGSCKSCLFLQKLRDAGFIKINIEWKNSVTTSTGFHPDDFALYFKESVLVSNKKNNCNDENHYHEPLDKLSLVEKLISCCTLLPLKTTSECTNVVFLIVKQKGLHQINGSNSPYVPKRNNKQKQSNHTCPSWGGPSYWLNHDDLQNFGVDLCQSLARNLVLNSDVTLIAQNGNDIGRKRKEIMKTFAGLIEISIAQSSVLREVRTLFDKLHTAILSSSKILVYQINTMAQHLHKQVLHDTCEDRECEEQLSPEISRVVQKNFNIGFEYLTEVIKLLSGPSRRRMEKIQLSCVEKWMKYVVDCLPKGKGFRPRWASLGLNFLANLNVDLLVHLSDKEYVELKQLISVFTDHLVGSKPSNEGLQVPSAAQPPPYRSLSSNSSKDGAQDKDSEFVYFEASDAAVERKTTQERPIHDIQHAIREMEETIDVKKMELGIIGQVIDCPSASPLVQLTIRSVSFQWQRGNKIGEGSFGRVFTCVNTNSGKILAMKEISFQPHDERHIKQALDEITNFEGITHQNLVKYYGVELHRDQMFIFMDYCDAGTLEEVSRIGLPEVMIQQYTAQLAAAVAVLHDRGFVHRDIKGSNIFLTTSGLLKLGDFGSAVRLLNRTKTLAGEIASHHGITAAYTAPEVINNNEDRGYGRAADIWSVGCVVIEMATGKRPWHDHEPFQIFYKVGMGSKPAVPNNLSHDGRTFINNCLEVDPNRRWNIHSLRGHPFVKVSLPVEG